MTDSVTRSKDVICFARVQESATVTDSYANRRCHRQFDLQSDYCGPVRLTLVKISDRLTIGPAATAVGAVSITLPQESTETNATLSYTLNTTALETSEIDPADIVGYRIDTARTMHDPVTVSVPQRRAT